MDRQVRLHKCQSRVFKDVFLGSRFDKPKYFPVNCSRGWGKSYLGAAAVSYAIDELLQLDPSVPNKNVYVVAPTYDQVTDIFYPILAYDLGMESRSKECSRHRGLFTFSNNVELRMVSYESIERMRGKGSYFVLMDEVSSYKKGIKPKEAWESVIQPTLTTRWSIERAMEYGAVAPGRSMMTSTPKGYNFFQELHSYGEDFDDWQSYTFDYTTSPYLSAEEIERLRHTMDPIMFASEYGASFAESGARVFYNFSRDKHVVDHIIPPVEGENVYAFIDFNVGKVCRLKTRMNSGKPHICWAILSIPALPCAVVCATTIERRYSTVL